MARLVRHGRAIIGPDRFLGVGYRLFHPEMENGAALAARVGAACREGVDGINFYAYGLVPTPRLDWVAEALWQVRQSA